MQMQSKIKTGHSYQDFFCVPWRSKSKDPKKMHKLFIGKHSAVSCWSCSAQRTGLALGYRSGNFYRREKCKIKIARLKKLYPRSKIFLFLVPSFFSHCFRVGAQQSQPGPGTSARARCVLSFGRRAELLQLEILQKACRS